MNILPLLTSVIICFSSAMLTSKQADLTLSIVKSLDVRQIGLVTNCATINIYDAKLFSKHLLRCYCVQDDFSVMFTISNTPSNNARTMMILADDAALSLNDFNEYSFSYNFEKTCIYIWLFFFTDKKMINNLKVRYDCEFYIAIENGETFDIYETYFVSSNRVVRNVGKWTSASGLYFPESNFFKRRLNTNGYVLQISNAEVRYGEEEIYDAMMDVITGMTILMNMTSEVATGFAYDVASYPSEVRTLVTIGPVVKIVLNMYVKYQTQSLDQYYIRPFDAEVWLAIFINIILMGLSILVVCIFTVEVTTFVELYGPTFLPLDCFCNQDSSEAFTDNDIVRILTFSCRLVSSVFYAAYSAVIISFLTVQLPFVPFKNLYEFANLGTYKLIGLPMQILQFYFAKDPLSVKVLELSLPEEDQPMNMTSQVQMLCSKNNFLTLGYSAMMSNFRKPCEVIKLKYPLSSSSLGFSYYIDFIMGPTVKKLLPYFFSNGIISRRQNILDAILEPDHIDLEAVELSVPFDRVAELLAIVPLGIALSFTIFLFECICYWIGSRIKRKRKTPIGQRRALFRFYEHAYAQFIKLPKLGSY